MIPIASPPRPAADGTVTAPSSPDLGIELDPGQVEHHTVAR